MTSHHDHHDDFGGLHRDLAATGAAIDRRGLFRLAARIGGAVGAFHLIGCGDSPTSPTAVSTTATSTTTTTTTTPPTTTNPTSSCSKIPEETQGPFPGDGSNGPNVLSAQRRRAKRYPDEFCGTERHRGRRAAHHRAEHRLRVHLRAARRPRGLPVALRSARPLLALLAGRDQPELPARDAGSGRERHGSPSRRFIPAAMQAGGRTFISRSIRACRPRRMSRTGWRRRKSR